MREKQKQRLTDLATELVIGREFPPRTPHTYAHTGQQVLRRFHLVPTQAPDDPLGANVSSLFPDLPETTVYYFPGQGQ